jgi:AcrR family transcriptional regulator
MSESVPGKGAVPKRARGHLRVQAILEAATHVFNERGYGAATMTEIAQRADTAIGSLYRFFPTKAALADGLLERYTVRIGALFDDMDLQLRERGGMLAGDTTAPVNKSIWLAQALVDMMLQLQPERAIALALVDAQGEMAAALRSAVRAMMLQRIENLLCRSDKGADEKVRPARTRASAKIILLLLKGIPSFADEPSREQKRLYDDLRILLQHHIALTLNE